MGNSERECDFWIRQIFIKSNGDLLFCSSQSMKPQLGSVDGHSLLEQQEFRTQIGICSQHEGLNTTAVYTEEGNPDGLPAIYSGIRTGLSLENQLIYRPPLMNIEGNREIHPALRTPIYDSNWLNEPQFVGSFSFGPFIYFFFREQLTAANCNNNKGSVVSRIARLCKNDLGGRQVLKQIWTSFVKANLNCSLNGFSFNQIQSVTYIQNEGNNNYLFYSTFIAAENTPYQSSAICVFSLSEINKVFDNGPFLEQQSAESGCWATIPAEQISIQGRRPGTCQEDSRQLSDEDLHFAKQHLLMAEQIQSLGNTPIIHKGQALLTTLIATIITEKEKKRENKNKVLLFVYEPNQNILFKFLHEYINNNKIKEGNAYLLAKYELSFNEKINSMAILPGEYIYLTNEKRVEQYRISQCSAYGQNCKNCVLDPFCSWSIPRRECFPMELTHSSSSGWLTDETSIFSCSKITKPLELNAFPGDSLHLKCPGGENENNIKWIFNGEKIFQSDKYILTKNGELILLNITENFGGIWSCLEDENKLIEYSIVVDGENCSKPKSIEQFHAVQREWCRRMDNYRNNLSKWQNLY
ncbi:hypothetical protein ACQ4LE_006328, partial [Meloidogyne hapla]